MDKQFIIVLSILGMIMGGLMTFVPVWFVAMNETSRRYRNYSGSYVPLSEKEVEQLIKSIRTFGEVLFLCGVCGLSILFVN